MIVYYAHCQAIYGTPQEDRDINLLQRMGHLVVNPANFDQKRIQEVKDKTGDVMSYFCDRVLQCDALAFRALPDGRIPAGVGVEITAARVANMPVFELPSGVRSRTMNMPETREYLEEVGQR